jgi:benzoylformate decarboxylase
VKWAQEVTHADQLPILVRRAFHDASAPPPGPVFLSLPMDVMEEMSTAGISERSVVDRRPVAGSLDRLAEQLAAIRPGRLAIIAGDEIHGSGAADEAVTIAEMLGAPVYGSSWPSRIPFPTANPLWQGNMPTKAVDIARRLSDYDAIFALGGKSLITILYTEGSAVPKDCAVFQMSADVRDLGRTYPTRLSVVGDLKQSLHALAPLLAREIAGRTEIYSALLRQAGLDQQRRRQDLASRAAGEMDVMPITPLAAAQEVVRAIGPYVSIVDEAIATSLHVRSFLDSSSPRQYSFLRGGALGWGMPAAVGCSLGLGREPVVSLVGDGAALYSPQALWTAAHEKLPVTFVVMNNREYNILKNFMKGQKDYASHRQNRFIAMDLDDPPIDYQAMAKSFGVPAQRVTRAGDIAGAVEAGIASGAPNLIEVVIGT